MGQTCISVSADISTSFASQPAEEARERPRDGDEASGQERRLYTIHVHRESDIDTNGFLFLPQSNTWAVAHSI